MTEQLIENFFGEDDQTLFIYELPEKAVKEVPRVEEVTPAPAS